VQKIILPGFMLWLATSTAISAPILNMQKGEAPPAAELMSCTETLRADSACDASPFFGKADATDFQLDLDAGGLQSNLQSEGAGASTAGTRSGNRDISNIGFGPHSGGFASRLLRIEGAAPDLSGPHPLTISLIGFGLAGFGFVRQRKFNKQVAVFT
jgi:hypothetical protein